MKRFYASHKKEIDGVLVFIAAIIAISLSAKYIARFFAPFIVAYILSLIISAPVDYVTKKTHIPRAFTTLFSMFIVMTALWLALSRLTGLLSEQLLSFALYLPTLIDRVAGLSANFRETYDNLFAFFPEETRAVFDQMLTTLVPSLTSWLGNYARALSVSTVKAIPKTFIFVIFTVIATFFMTNDRLLIRSFIARQFPESIKKHSEILMRDIFGALWGYVKAQLILMCFTGVIAVIGLTALGYEYSLLIGLLIACLDSLPVFGPGFILWPWAAFSIFSGEFGLSVGLLVLYLVLILCRQALEPKVLSSQIGLYPLVTLISIYVGLMVFGPIGLIAGPLLAIITRSLQKAGLLPDWK